MNNNEIHTINGKKFRIVVDNNEIKTVSVITDSYKEVPASKEDIQNIINMLNEKLENSYDEHLTEKITINSIVELIKTKIEDKELKSNEEYLEYLQSLDITEDQRKEVTTQINEYLKELMHTPFNERMDEYYQKSSEIIHQTRQPNEHLNISFSVSNGFITQKIEIFDQSQGKAVNVLTQTYEYDSNVKQGLINPIVQELCTINEPILNTNASLDMFYCNYYLKFDNNINLSIIGIEKTYAEDLEKLARKTNKLTDDEIKENINNKTEYQNMTPEDQLDSDLKDYANLTNEEQEALKNEKGYTKVRTLKKNNAAHISTVVIFSLVTMGLALLIYLGYIILK